MNKTFLILATFFISMVIIAIIMHFSNPHENIQSEFKAWMKKYNKTYSNENEYQARLKTFKINKARVSMHNKLYDAGKETYFLGLNSKADISDAERKQLLGTKVKYDLIQNKKIEILDEHNLVPSVNWISAGAVTPVKDQLQCNGGDWAFSATGALESYNYIKNKQLQQFSEQELIDCSDQYGNQGCQQGNINSAFTYAAKLGEELESNYRYTGSKGDCQHNSQESFIVNNDYREVVPESSNQLKAAIQQQPISVAVKADSYQFQLYQGGVFQDSGCGQSIDHGVLAVGYETDGQAHYLVKNSWGGSWGEEGYIKLAETGDGSGICGIQIQPSYPVF